MRRLRSRTRNDRIRTPRFKLTPGLRDQLTRAAESVVLNLAEGSAKPSARDRARFYGISLGSFRESQSPRLRIRLRRSALRTQLLGVSALEVLALAGERALIERFDGLGGMLYKLSRSAK